MTEPDDVVLWTRCCNILDALSSDEHEALKSILDACGEPVSADMLARLKSYGLIKIQGSSILLTPNGRSIATSG